jgi:hypothetical protein
MSQKKRKEEIETEFDDDERAGEWAHIMFAFSDGGYWRQKQISDFHFFRILPLSTLGFFNCCSRVFSPRRRPFALGQEGQALRRS